MNIDLAQLRKKFDSQDPFMSNGHQMIRPREDMHRRLDWTEDNKIVGEVLLRSWPHMRDRSSKKYYLHALKARLWLHIILFYFRLGMTAKQVADEPSNVNWKLTPKRVNHLALTIKRAGERYSNGILPKPRGGKRPRAGRPKTQIKSFCFRIKGLRRGKIKKRCLQHLTRSRKSLLRV
jgi:hypothetical protein